jgi:hypothetical protein
LCWLYLVRFSSVSTVSSCVRFISTQSLKLRVSANVEHVLCFIIYLNDKYD